MPSDADDVLSLEVVARRGAHKLHNGSYLGGVSVHTTGHSYEECSRENSAQWPAGRRFAEHP